MFLLFIFFPSTALSVCYDYTDEQSCIENACTWSDPTCTSGGGTGTPAITTTTTTLEPLTTTTSSLIIFSDGFNYYGDTSGWSNDYIESKLTDPTYFPNNPWTVEVQNTTLNQPSAGTDHIIVQGSNHWGNVNSTEGPTFVALKRPVVDIFTTLTGLDLFTTYKVEFKARNRQDCGKCGNATLFVSVDDTFKFEREYNLSLIHI